MIIMFVTNSIFYPFFLICFLRFQTGNKVEFRLYHEKFFLSLQNMYL